MFSSGPRVLWRKFKDLILDSLLLFHTEQRLQLSVSAFSVPQAKPVITQYPKDFEKVLTRAGSTNEEIGILP